MSASVQIARLVWKIFLPVRDTENGPLSDLSPALQSGMKQEEKLLPAEEMWDYTVES